MNKLFAVYLGGRADGCNIELHDVVFVAGTSIEEAYPLLKKKWFGNSHRLHIDSYVDLQYVDGHELELMKEPTQVVPEKKLYFINFGAYRTHEFTEHHQNAFYVAASLPEALKRAKDELCLGMEMIHKDDGFLIDRVSQLTEFDVDDVLEIEEVDDFYVSLKPTASANRPLPHSAYIKLEVV